MVSLRKIQGALERGLDIVLEDTYRSNHQVIREASDFPNPEARTIDGQDKTVIPLETGVEYEINGTVTHDYPILGNGQEIHGTNWPNDILVYTGSDSQLIYRDNAFFVSHLSFIATTGQVLDLQAPDTTEFLTDNCAVLSANDLGEIDGYNVPSLEKWSFEQYDNGLTFTGTPRKIHIVTCQWARPNGNTVGLTFDGNAGLDVDLIHMEGNFFKNFNSTDDAIEVTGNPLSDFGIVTSTLSDLNLKSRIVGFSKTDAKWQFGGNSDVPDSTVSGVADLDGTFTVSVSVGDGDAGNPKKVTGASNPDALERFSHSNSTLTYTGVKDREVRMSANATLQSTGGAEIDVTLYLAKNGTVNEVGNQTVTLGSGGQSRSVRAESYFEVSENDDIEMFIENITNTDDIQINDLDLLGEET